MQSPLSIHQKLLGNYQEYLSKQFKSLSISVTEGRNNLYKTKGVTYQPPFLEFLFNYKGSGIDFKLEGSTKDLASYFITNEDCEKFRKLAAAGLVPVDDIYQHQWQMLLKTLLENKHAIITTGTGSGKTESFMLPLVAYLAKQSTTYQRPDYKLTIPHNGFRDALFTKQDNGIFKRGFSQKRPNLRLGESRKAAVRAIMLFPMNALVEDQLKRIRNTFSNPQALDVLDQHFNGNRIFYGKYNGVTEGNGKFEEPNDFLRVNNYYQKVAINEHEIIEYADSIPLINQKRYTEALDYFGREISEDGSSLTGEMLNRFDMQKYPPDILITNFSMLNIMLTRELEQSIWDKTAEWLLDEDAVFHVVLDEMHLYRGSAGTEIAYSISALLERLGIANKPNKVRFLASSASLDLENDEQRVTEFIGGFFNIPSNKVKDQFHLEVGAHAFPKVDLGNGLDDTQIKELLYSINDNIESGNFPNDETLSKMAISRAIVDIFNWYNINEGAKNKPCSLETLGEEIARYFRIEFIPLDLENLSSSQPLPRDLSKLVNGFLLFRELIASRKKERKGLLNDNNLPRIRMHMMYNNFEGLWGSISASIDNRIQINKTFNYPKKIDAYHNKVYQLFYCEKCETSFIGGYRDSNKKFEVPDDALPGNDTYYVRKITPTETNLATDSRSTVSTDTNKLKYSNYSIFWPENQFDGNSYHQHIPESQLRDMVAENEYINKAVLPKAYGYWVRAFFNPVNGEVHVPVIRNAFCPEGFILGRIYISLNNNSGENIYTDTHGKFTNKFIYGLKNYESSNDESALSQCCPSCATKKNLTPIVRGYRTGFNKTNQLFASGLFKTLKKYNADENTSLPKLVSFSDSRDEAAQVAAGVESEHFNELITSYLLSSLRIRIYSDQDKIKLIQKLLIPEISGEINQNIDVCKELFDNIIQQNISQTEILKEIIKLIEELKLDQNHCLAIVDLFNNYKNNIVQPSTFTPNELVGRFAHGTPFSKLHEHLISFGVDIRGVYNVKQFLSRQSNEPILKWYEPIQAINSVFSFSSADQNIHTRYDNSEKYLKAQLLGLMFHHSQFSLEAMGLGKLVTTWDAPKGFPQQHWNVFIYGMIKLMGWKGKYRPRLVNKKKKKYDEEIITPKQNLPSYLKAYVEKFNNVKNETINFSDVLGLFSGNLVFLDFQNNNSPVRIKSIEANEKFISCKQCSEVYSQVISHCLNCGKEFRTDNDFNSIKVEEIRNRSYSGSHNSNLKDIHRLHCEELSGQTDDPFERQRNFLGLIKDTNITKLAKEIDLLAVTTTLEVGVDIGSLQGMLMANMPPQRFNYQQRVGRVGRRGQAFSFAVTLCRSKSHDAHYFQHPDEITGNPSPTPFLNVLQNEILERVLNKFFLAYFYREFKKYLFNNFQETDWNDVFSTKDINGEFGNIKGFSLNNPQGYHSHLENFLLNKSALLEDYFSKILIAIKRDGNLFNKLYKDYIDGLFQKIGIIVNKSPESAGLGESLMEHGLLPSYGMPTKVAQFYNNYDFEENNKAESGKNTPDSMDRTIDVAIFDYSPGTIKLKDKFEYSVKAIVPNVIQQRVPRTNYFKWESDGDEYRSKMIVYKCITEGCERIELVAVNENEVYPEKDCPNCNQKNSLSKSDIIAIEPKNFSIIPNDKDETEKKDVSSNNRLALSGLGIIRWDFQDNQLGNLCLDFKESEEDKYIYKINKGANGSILLKNRNNIIGNLGNVNGMVLETNGTQNAKQYWLYTRKNTETLSFIAKDFYNKTFDLKFHDGIHNKELNLSKKAVFLSAATIIQRCFADILDIDPREIEFTNPDITSVDVKGQLHKTFQITFYDSHDNGSGYVRKIKELMENSGSIHEFIQTSKFYKVFIDQSHKESCISGSCYKCIRTYENSMLHGLLDWRLGLDLVAYMGTEKFSVDFDSFKNYVLSKLSGSGFSTELIEDGENNKAIAVYLNAKPELIVTHPITRFDVGYFKAENVDFKDTDAIDLYHLSLIS